MRNRRKIQLYEVRDFGRNFSATFDFLKENAKVCLRALLYCLLPVCLVQSVSLNSFMGSVFNAQSEYSDFSYDFPLLSITFTVILYFIGYSMVSGIFYTLMMEYNRNKNRLRKVSLKALAKEIRRASLRSLLMLVMVSLAGALLFVGLIIFVVATESFFVLFGLLFALFAVTPLILAVPAYIFDDEIGFFAAFRRGVHIGYSKFFPFLLMMIVMTMLVNFIQTATYLPWYFATMLKGILVIDGSDSAIASSGLYSYLVYILGVIQSFGMYVSLSLFVVAIGFFYTSAMEEEYSVSVNSDIDNFEDMSDESSDIENFELL
ncbi:MAG: hypothetical protein K6A98_04330 [Prevotella sp.]|nr:hypothetical protein [Prevotella sp.]